jgi:hypothetical protein
MFNGRPSVYLAGPITGASYAGCTKWREDVTYALAPDIVCFSPRRRKEDLVEGGKIRDDYVGNVLSCSRGIITRDYYDCVRHELVYARLLEAERVSIGTVMEIAWAYQARIPIIAVMEKQANLHDHGMIRECIGFRVETDEEAIAVTKAILLP